MSKDPEIIGAAQKMEELFKSGKYQQRKYQEFYLQQTRKAIEQTFDGDREIFKNIGPGVIVERQYVPTYETDYTGLNEFLAEKDLLLPTINIDFSEMKKKELVDELKPCELPVKFYARMTPNKKGRVNTDDLTVDTDGLRLDQLTKKWWMHKKAFDQLDAEIEKLRVKMEKCPHLQAKKKLKCKYGSVSLIAKKPKYDIQKVFDTKGIDFLIQHGKPDMEMINNFILAGLLKQKDVLLFRKIIDMKSRIVVMDVDSASRQSQFIANKRSRFVS